MVDKQTVLVTGAAGFVGGWIAETMHLSRFVSVRAGIRRWSSAARIARFPMEIVICDIMDHEQIAQAMAGANAVVHCAYTDNREIIVQGTKNMLEVAFRQGVESFIYLSTAEVYGKDVRGRIDETFPYQYTGSEYADSKIEAEKLCWEFYGKGLPVTILRPSIVYGPFSERTNGYAQRLQSGNWGIFKNYGDGKCNLVYADDLVSATLLAISQEEAVGEAFNINGPEVITWNQYFQRFNDVLDLPNLHEISSGRSAFKTAVRDSISAFSGFFLDRFGDPIMNIYLRGGSVSKFMKHVKNSLFTTPSAKELQGLYNRDALYVDSKAQNLLGYNPRFDLDTGLQMCVLWLNHHGFLDKTPSQLSNGTNYDRNLELSNQQSEDRPNLRSNTWN